MADLTLTSGSLLKSANAQMMRAIAAVTILAGQYIYMLADGTVGLADSNGTAPSNSCCGVALNGGAVGQPINYVPSDTALVHGLTGVVSGDVIYLSNTPGAATKLYSDIASLSTVITLGIASSATVMSFQPLVGGVK